MCEPAPYFDNKRFWVVWVSNRGEPTVRHTTLDAAKIEAEALSKKYPGERAFVLRARGYGYTDKPTTPPTAFSLLEPRPK